MRSSRDQTWIDVAAVIARRSTCWRRAVGCVLTDEDGIFLSSGYNGVASGRPHCNEEVIVTELVWETFQPAGVDGEYVQTVINKGYTNRCPGSEAPSGQNLDACQALHAEQNAIIWLSDPSRVHTAYCTASPCISCVKLFLGTNCQRVVFLEEYPHPTAKEWWIAAGREWVHIK